MALTAQEIEKIAQLARINLSEAEKQTIAAQLSSILDYVAKLNELNTDDVQPLASALDLHNVFREDKPGEPLTPTEALDNAPAHTNQFFKVPKTIQ